MLDPHDICDDYQPGINLTPLLDLTLLMLIMFITTSATAITTMSIPVVLPTAKASLNTTDSNNEMAVVIAITRDGYFVNGQAIEFPELSEQLRRASGDEVKLRVELHGDARVEYEKVVRVLDVLQDAGITAVNLGTTPIPSSKTSAPITH